MTHRSQPARVRPALPLRRWAAGTALMVASADPAAAQIAAPEIEAAERRFGAAVEAVQREAIDRYLDSLADAIGDAGGVTLPRTLVQEEAELVRQALATGDPGPLFARSPGGAGAITTRQLALKNASSTEPAENDNRRPGDVRLLPVDAGLAGNLTFTRPLDALTGFESPGCSATWRASGLADTPHEIWIEFSAGLYGGGTVEVNAKAPGDGSMAATVVVDGKDGWSRPVRSLATSATPVDGELTVTVTALEPRGAFGVFALRAVVLRPPPPEEDEEDGPGS